MLTTRTAFHSLRLFKNVSSGRIAWEFKKAHHAEAYAVSWPDCSRRYDVINRGFSGYNTSQALNLLDKLFPKQETGGPKLKYLVRCTLPIIRGL